MLKITHADVTRQTVWDAFRPCHEVRLRERYHAVLLWLDGHPCPDIAQWLYRDEDTIRLWIHAVNEQRLKACRVLPFRGVRRDCTRSTASPSKRSCVRAHARLVTP